MAATSSMDSASGSLGAASAVVGAESPVFTSASASPTVSMPIRMPDPSVRLLPEENSFGSGFSMPNSTEVEASRRKAINAAVAANPTKNYGKMTAARGVTPSSATAGSKFFGLASYEEGTRNTRGLNIDITYEEDKITRELAYHNAHIPFTRQPIVKVATCNLNQFALDFAGNQKRIIESITLAKQAGCTYRLGPELEITGYSCEDHFYELDTINFAWMSLSDIIAAGHTDGILCDFGMPVLHNGVRYNCRVFVLGKRILLIRPKMWMADDGNYREDRHFTPWAKSKMEVLEEYSLPEEIRSTLGGQTTAPFGIGIIECVDGTIGSEVCEELFTAESINIYLGFEGVDIMSNGSASHFQMGKRLRRHDMIKEATKKNGGIYLYSNMLGCDGNRMVFDGNGMIYMNGELKAVGEHLSFQEVEMVIATLNLNDVRTYRASSVSHQIQSDQRSIKMPRVKVDFHLANNTATDIYAVTDTIDLSSTKIEMEEEMGLSVSRYLWDYLCRSGTAGFMLPLSGGVDSSSTALMVYFMCDKIVSLLKGSTTDSRLKALLTSRINAKILMNYPTLSANNFSELTPQTLMNVILHTVNLPTKNNTSEIKWFAYNLAEALGCFHMTVSINDSFVKLREMVKTLQFGYEPDPVEPVGADGRVDTSKKMNVPRYQSKGGDWAENLAIQNIQARLRMIAPYYLAQIIPMYRYNQQKLQAPGEGITWKQFHDKLDEWERELPVDTELELNTKVEEAGNEAYKKFYETWIKNGTRPNNAPGLLVLASSNSDEAIRGFFTKYDASSADLNPIGSFSKTELRKYLAWCVGRFSGSSDRYSSSPRPATVKPQNFGVVNEILTVTASPELTPAQKSAGGKVSVQDDEIEIQMTYDDLYEFGLMRKRDNLGPLGMFHRMCKQKLGGAITSIRNKTKIIEAATPNNIADKLSIFWDFYGKTRSKMPILTPSIHATNYSPDDNRFDQRPFLYPYFPGSYQITLIKSLASKMMDRPDVIEFIKKGDIAAHDAEIDENDEKKRESKSFKEKFELRETEYLKRRPNIVAKRASEKAKKEQTNLEKSLEGLQAGGARSQKRRVTRNKAREQRRRTAKFGNLN